MRRPRRTLIPALISSCLLAGAMAPAAAVPAAAATLPIAEFPVPSSGSDPAGITVGPDGNLWFTELQGSKIGRINPSGVIIGEFLVPAGSLVTEFPAGICAGPDGNVWFVEAQGNKIGRFTPAGVLQEFAIPTTGAFPVDIVNGPDGNLWFTEGMGNKVGRITRAGAVKEFAVPTASAAPAGIAVGPDGNLWFTELQGNRIGRITPAGAIREFPVTAGSQPVGIAAGADGNLWFGEIGGNAIGRLTTTGSLTEFPLPTPSAEPIIVTPGPDGNIWFTELQGNNIGSITPAGAIVEYALPTAGASPGEITTGPDGNLWFTEITAGKIARATPPAGGPCISGDATLCLDDRPGDRRWQVSVSFNSSQGSGSAHAIPLASLGVSHGGLFWFFGASNPEMLIKVLNGCAVNKSFWVFSSATTNVGFTITVRDTGTGRVKTYRNRDGTAAPPVQDTSALACTGSDLAAAATAASADSADTATPQMAAAREADAAVEAAACATAGATLCIAGRFKVQVTYRTAQAAGNGIAIALDGLGVTQGGLFWFFGADNPEMLIKVIDGCTLNDRLWIFYAAGTNVGFTVTVTDTQTGHVKVYTHRNGSAAVPLQDTSALPCG